MSDMTVPCRTAIERATRNADASAGKDVALRRGGVL